MTLTINTPYLNIKIPNNLMDPIPVWGQDLQNALLAFDSYLGSLSAGEIDIPSSNITITGDLSFAYSGNYYNLTNVRALRLTSLSTVPTSGSDINEFVVVNGDGYFINSVGTAIRLTQGSSIVSGSEQYIATTAQGNYTVQATDTYGFYAVNTTSTSAIINLPPSSSQNVGRFRKFQDINFNSETNSITFVPNGTDKIAGSNSNFVFQHNGGEIEFVSDGSSSWDVWQSGESFIRQNKIAFSSGTVVQNSGIVFSSTATPSIVQTVATAAGANLTISAQSAGGSNNTGGNITLQSGAKTGSGYDGYIFFEAGSTVEAFVLSSNATSAGGLGIGSTPGTDPVITKGTGVPTTTQPNGSLFLRTDGTNASALYVRQSAVWSAIAPGLAAPVAAGIRTITGTYTVDASGNDYLIYIDSASAFNLTLPAPTLGRVLVVKDISGALETNNCTLVRHGSENIEGLAASRVLNTNWGNYTISSDGTNWFIGN